MIAFGIRRFARQRGLTCHGGYAYGRVGGRYIMLDEGAGYKRLQVYLYPLVEDMEGGRERDEAVLKALTDCDLKEFRLTGSNAVCIAGGFAQLVFHDTVGTMGRIIRYIDEILPRLDGLKLEGNLCARCGEAISGEASFVQLDGRILPVHGDCVRQLEALAEQVQQEERTGSVLRGLAGAFLGAVLGAAVYALMFAMGRIAAVAGLVIGLAASKLYDRFGGRQSAWKLPVVIVMLVLGVLLGQAACYSVEFSGLYDDIGYTDDEISRVEYVQECWEMYLIYDQETALGLQYDRRFKDIPEAMRISREDHIRMTYMREIDTIRMEMRNAFARNYMTGLMMALLGCIPVLMENYNRNIRRRMRIMK